MKPETMHRMARVLAAANSRPQRPDEFYKIKSALCHAFAADDGIDVQHIAHGCWGYYREGCGPECDKCGGTGIYSNTYVRLRRWNLCGRSFHEPVGRIEYQEAHRLGITIQGKVKHKLCRRSTIACAAIGRLFDSAYYWAVLKQSQDERFGHFVRRSEQVARWVVGAEDGLRRFTDARMSRTPVFIIPSLITAGAPF